MYILGIETSCDETAVAVVEKSPGKPTRVAGEVVSSQIALHQPFGGVVPEMATREHLRNLPHLVPQVLAQAGLTLPQLDAVAVTEGPGLASSLLIGHSYARALATALSKPIYGINHLEGHLFSPFLAQGEPIAFPFVGLIVSGGHTLLVHVMDWERYIKLGSTVDDAAGEAFDKVARLLNLPYPGGPEIERLAAGGNPEAYALPRSFPERDNLNFSFSGLKTAVRLFVDKAPLEHQTQEWKIDLCASFQKAVVDVLVRKAVLAVEKSGVTTLACSGGVLSNATLREELAIACLPKAIKLVVTDRTFSTDNAAMIAGTAAEKIAAGVAFSIGDDIDPNLSLFTSQPAGDFSRSLSKAIQLKYRQRQSTR